MIENRDIDALMGADVVDDGDDRIGKVSQVYVDSKDQHPSWVAVKTGFFGSAETLVPIEDASWDSARLHVGVSKDKVKDAPHVDPDREITVDEQNALYRHYGIAASVDHESAADDDGATGATTGRHAATDGAGTDRGADGATAVADRTADDDRQADVERDSAAGTVVSDSGSYTVEDATPTADATDATEVGAAANDEVAAAGSATIADESRSADAVHAESADQATPDTGSGAQSDREEAGAYSEAERVAEDGPVSPAATTTNSRAGDAGASAAGAGFRMRLRKVTVTEERTVTVTVPVTHEEVRLERVPDDEPDGPDVIDGETEVVLMEERPVVTTEQVASERVHVSVDRVADDQTTTAG